MVPRAGALPPPHRDWLGQHAGDASALWRPLVERSLRHGGAKERARQAAAAVERFMRAAVGDEPGYGEPARACWRDDRERFHALVADCPLDVRAAAEAGGGCVGRTGRCGHRVVTPRRSTIR